MFLIVRIPHNNPKAKEYIDQRVFKKERDANQASYLWQEMNDFACEEYSYQVKPLKIVE